MSATSTASPAAPAPRRPPLLRRGAVTMLLLIAPSVVLLVLINAYPLFVAALQSVRDGSLISDGSFIGLQNYVDALTSPRFWKSAGFTLAFTLVGVFGSWAIGLGLALLLRLRTPGRNVFRVLLLLPWVVPVVVSSTSWNFLVGTPDSLAPSIARMLGLGEVYFLADPVMAAVTVCVFKVWISFPFMRPRTWTARTAGSSSAASPSRSSPAPPTSAGSSWRSSA
jgi:multiple sugar transport system permease protein